MLVLTLAHGVALPQLAAAQPAGPAELEQVAKLVQDGQTRFETADFVGAIEAWTQAYAALPGDPSFAEQRNVLVYQIAQACVEAHAIDPQAIYLRKAERLFMTYLDTLDPAADAETIVGVQTMIADLQAKIAAAQTPTSPPTPTPPAANTKDEATPETPPTTTVATSPKHRPFVLSGAVLLGVGALGLGMMTYGLARGRAIDARGQAAVDAGNSDQDLYRSLLRQGYVANRLAIAAGITTAILVVTGSVLLGVGVRMRQRPAHALRWSPLGVRSGAGLTVGWRF